MKSLVLLLVPILFMAFPPDHSQEKDILFRSEPREIPFIDFVGLVEGQSDARFFYRDEWVRDLKVRLPGGQTSLREVLEVTLEPAHLAFRIGEGDEVYLIPGQKIIGKLPDYRVVVDSLGTGTKTQPVRGLTDTEQKYIEGRKAGIRETLIVGKAGGEGSGQGAVVFGKMSDRATGEPLIGATIYVSEIRKGAVTDVDGRFSIVLRPGRYTADFSCLGMQTLHTYLDVRSGGNLDIEMEKSLIPISEVVIEASRYHNVRGTQMGFERLSYKTVKEVPLAMGEKDLLKVAQMLPGVQSVGEGASGFNVRGSAADQNMIYVNKVPLYNSSHLFGFFSSINPDIIKDFSLYKSNLPASFGGRLASFFDISTRQGNTNSRPGEGSVP